jgi:DNA-binding NarL/FixJ family response regulator
MKSGSEAASPSGVILKDILVVDDSRLIRSRLKDLLLDSELKCTIWEAGNIKEALTAFNEAMPGIAILDLRLKNENGMALIEPLKKINPDVTIIMLTNFPDEFYRKKCFELGADYFFSKISETELALDTCLTIASGNS